MTERTKATAPAQVLAVLTQLALVDCRATARRRARLMETQELSDLDYIALLTDLFHNAPIALGSADTNRACQEQINALWSSRGDRRAWRNAWLEAAVEFVGLDRSSAIFEMWA